MRPQDQGNFSIARDRTETQKCLFSRLLLPALVQNVSYEMMMPANASLVCFPR